MQNFTTNDSFSLEYGDLLRIKDYESVHLHNRVGLFLAYYPETELVTYITLFKSSNKEVLDDYILGEKESSTSYAFLKDYVSEFFYKNHRFPSYEEFSFYVSMLRNLGAVNNVLDIDVFEKNYLFYLLNSTHVDNIVPYNQDPVTIEPFASIFQNIMRTKATVQTFPKLLL